MSGDVVAPALAAWWSARAEEFRQDWFGPAQPQRFAAIERDLPLLDALVAAAAPEVDPLGLLGTVAALWPFWAATARAEHGDRLMAQLLARLPESLADSAQAQLAHWALAWSALHAGDLGRADAAIALTRTGREQLAGIRALYAGDAAAARAHLEVALRADRDAADEVVYFDDYGLAAAHSLAGDQELALDHCERAIELCDGRGERWLKNYVLWAFALSAWRDGDARRALAIALDGVAAAALMHDRHAAALCLDIVSWYEAGAGDVAAGARLLGVADALRAETGEAESAWGVAEHRERAAELGRRRGGDSFERERARWSHRQHEQPDTWLAVAAELTADEEPRAAAALTPRQLEIARLIAEGRSNKEIARLLLITVRTVETHIGHVFVKLGVVSRAQIAAWSVRELSGR